MSTIPIRPLLLRDYTLDANFLTCLVYIQNIPSLAQAIKALGLGYINVRGPGAHNFVREGRWLTNGNTLVYNMKIRAWVENKK